MKCQIRFLDIGSGPSVMVDDRNPVAGLQQAVILHLLRAVSIHNHQQRAAVRHKHGLLWRDKGPGIFRLLLQPADQRFRGVLLPINDNSALPAFIPGNAAYGHRAAHRIQVGMLMPHNEYPGGVRNQFCQRVSHHPGFDLRPRLNFVAASSVKHEVEAVFHHGLVTPPGEGHLHSQGAELQILSESRSAMAYADADRGMDSRGAYHFAYVLQHGKFLFRELLQPSLLKNEKVAVAVIPAHDGVLALAPLGDDVLHGVAHLIFDSVRLVFHHLIVIIDDDRRHNGT